MKNTVRTSDHVNRKNFRFLLIEILPFSEIIFQIKKPNGLCPGILRTVVGFRLLAVLSGKA